jgi:predicted dehydrogenase
MPSHSILVIGCGSIGERHLRCFVNTGRARVVGCEPNEELRRRISTTYGVTVVSDWEQALSEGFDGVVICTPAPLHIRMGTAALRSGAHVLIEKPLSQSFDGVSELLEARDATRRIAAVAYVLHGNPVLRAARDFLATSPFGKIQQATVVSGQCFPFFRPAYAQTYYRDRRTGGGAIQDALTHTVNWVESVIGPTTSVLCDCAHQVLPNVEVEDTVHVSTRHASGALANFSLNQFQAPNETVLQFNASGGSVRIEMQAARWGTFAKGDSEWTWHSSEPMGRDGPFSIQAHAFLDQMEGKPTPLCSLEAGIDTLRFNLAALTSADTGRRVRCDEVGAPRSLSAAIPTPANR